MFVYSEMIFLRNELAFLLVVLMFFNVSGNNSTGSYAGDCDASEDPANLNRSLAFVVDMDNDARMLLTRHYLMANMQHFINSTNGWYTRFILVKVNDPFGNSQNNTIIKKTPAEFVTAVERMEDPQATPNGDSTCPKPLLHGINAALEYALNSSYSQVHVFSVSTAQDSDMLDEVLGNLAITQNQVNWISTSIFPPCGTNFINDTKATDMMKVVAASAGFMLIINPKDIPETLDWIGKQSLSYIVAEEYRHCRSNDSVVCNVDVEYYSAESMPVSVIGASPGHPSYTVIPDSTARTTKETTKATTVSNVTPTYKSSPASNITATTTTTTVSNLPSHNTTTTTTTTTRTTQPRTSPPTTTTTTSTTSKSTTTTLPSTTTPGPTQTNAANVTTTATTFPNTSTPTYTPSNMKGYVYGLLGFYANLSPAKVTIESTVDAPGMCGMQVRISKTNIHAYVKYMLDATTGALSNMPSNTTATNVAVVYVNKTVTLHQHAEFWVWTNTNNSQNMFVWVKQMNVSMARKAECTSDIQIYQSNNFSCPGDIFALNIFGNDSHGHEWSRRIAGQCRAANETTSSTSTTNPNNTTPSTHQTTTTTTTTSSAWWVYVLIVLGVIVVVLLVSGCILFVFVVRRMSALEKSINIGPIIPMTNTNSSPTPCDIPNNNYSPTSNDISITKNNRLSTPQEQPTSKENEETPHVVDKEEYEVPIGRDQNKSLPDNATNLYDNVPTRATPASPLEPTSPVPEIPESYKKLGFKKF